MSELIVLPYAARLVIGCLLDATEVTALVSTNIGTDLPKTPVANRGVVRVTQFPGRIVEGSSIYWLETTILQLDCWGPGGNDRIQAHNIAETCRAVLQQRLTGTVEYEIGTSTVNGVVSGTEVGGIADDSDDAFQPARPRSRFDVTVTAHPAPVGS